MAWCDSLFWVGVLAVTGWVAAAPATNPAIENESYVAYTFEAQEGWRASGSGPLGATALHGRTWHFDFTKGASSISLGPPSRSLLGTPQQFTFRFHGAAPGHPLRVRLKTHGMFFVHELGELKGPGEHSLTIAAPPGPGWTFFGGENDGKLHSPLVLDEIRMDGGGRKDSGDVELIGVEVVSGFLPHRACVAWAETRATDGQQRFTATIRGLLKEPTPATIHWTINDWAGNPLVKGERSVMIPAHGGPVQAKIAFATGANLFLEARFLFDAPGQLIPEVQACYAAPLEEHRDATLEPASPFGMGLYLYRYGRDEQTMERAARAAQDAGVKWSREQFNWSDVEIRKGEYDWSYYDRLVATATRHGISIYAVLISWPGWTKPYTAEGDEDYCRFAAAAAARYRGSISHWEIWNEPNIFFWQGPRDFYARLLKLAGPAIHGANPDARVLGCSTSGIDLKFISRTIELGGTFDILTIHPYRKSLDDSGFIHDLDAAANASRQPDGSTRPVWITEIGWATGVPHNRIPGYGNSQVITQRSQAELLARVYLDALAAAGESNRGARRPREIADGANISWYDFRNDGDDPFNIENNMGIVNHDFTPKPAYRAFATLTRVLHGFRFDKTMDLGKGVIAYSFTGGTAAQMVLAVWVLDHDRTVEVPAVSDMELIDLMGQRRLLTVKGGRVAVDARAGVPVFLMPRT